MSDEFTAPNLDAMEVEDLAVFQKNATLLARYAGTKIKAMMLRKAGEIEIAMKREKECDAIYKLIPENIRW